MLIFVHLTQIARNITTFETMRGAVHAGPIMTAIATGTMSVDGAQVDGAGTGPNAAGHAGHTHPRTKREGCLSQWYKLLGMDTFFTVAFQGYQGSKASRAEKQRMKRANPYSRGLVRNCQDFWMDGPIFGTKTDGCKALIGGESVDYATLYDVPRGGMQYRGIYEAVATGEEEEDV